MKKTIVLLLLLAALPLAAQERRERNHVDRAFAALGDLGGAIRRVIPFDDGSRFVIHAHQTAADPKGMSAVLVGAGGVHHFSAASLLPAGSVGDGHLGQIYSAARLGAGELAISIGYVTAAGRVTTAVAFTALRDGKWTTTRVVDFPAGVRDVLAGPGGTLLAVTTDLLKLRKEGVAPLLTVIDREGRVAGEMFDVVLAVHASDAARNAVGTRLQRLGDGRFALFEPDSASVRIFDLARSAGGRFEPFVRQTISVAAVPQEVAASRVAIIQGVHVDRDGRVHVARSYASDKKAASVESIYDATGAIEHRTAPRAYQATFWIDDTIHGLANQ